PHAAPGRGAAAPSPRQSRPPPAPPPRSPMTPEGGTRSMAPAAGFAPLQPTEQLSVPQNVIYNWEYDATRKRLMRLYENAKRDQWNGTERLDWSIDVHPESQLVTCRPIPIY